MNDIYKDIAERTGGDIQIGVVGPVRSGKSTFITKVMEQLVIPNISGKNKLRIAVDELPQSAQGKTVMTTEPKFVPGEAVTVRFDKAQAKIRLIDCVGYMVDGAIGHEENGAPRMVKTPWSDEEMPFIKAGEYGTQKVVGEHATVGLVVTSDGTFTDVERSAYERAEERVVKELKSFNKPFIVLFNTVDPRSEAAISTCRELENKYGVAVVPTNVTTLDKAGITEIFERLLSEFPLRLINVGLPVWMQALSPDDEMIADIIAKIRSAAGGIKKMSDYKKLEKAFSGDGKLSEAEEVSLDMASGTASLKFSAGQGLFLEVLSKECGEKIDGEFTLLTYVRELKEAKAGYNGIRSALERSLATGYGIVPADVSDAEIDKPKVVKKNGQYCVKIGVAAKSLHLIKADVHTEVEVVSGTKEQCDGFAASLTEEGGQGMDTEVFGRPVKSVIAENVVSKSCSLTENVMSKLKRTVNKAVNEKKTGLICILI